MTLQWFLNRVWFFRRHQSICTLRLWLPSLSITLIVPSLFIHNMIMYVFGNLKILYDLVFIYSSSFLIFASFVSSQSFPWISLWFDECHALVHSFLWSSNYLPISFYYRTNKINERCKNMLMIPGTIHETTIL